MFFFQCREVSLHRLYMLFFQSNYLLHRICIRKNIYQITYRQNNIKIVVFNTSQNFSISFNLKCSKICDN